LDPTPELWPIWAQRPKLLASNHIDLSWATIYPLAQGDLGFQEMLAGHSNNIKGILDMR
jgi:hypothetical protein